MRFHLILAILIVGTATPVGIVFALDEFADDVKLQNAKSVFFSDHAVSISRTNSAGDGSGSFLNLRGFDGIILRSRGDGSFGTGNEAFRITPNGDLSMANAKSVIWIDNAVSISRTNTSGDGPGSFLTLRGFDGIVFSTKGDGFFGTGVEGFRITPAGDLTVVSGKSVKWVDNAVSLSRTNTSGDGSGSFLNLRGFNGIVMRTGGDGFFGTGNEAFRINPSGNVGIGVGNPIQKLDVNGNIRLTGNIVSPNDICIGNCP